jgi:hypothetical protein
MKSWGILFSTKQCRATTPGVFERHSFVLSIEVAPKSWQITQWMTFKMIQNDSQNFKDIQLYPVSDHAAMLDLEFSKPRAAGSSLDVELIDAGVSRWVSRWPWMVAHPPGGDESMKVSHVTCEAYLLWRPVAIQLLHCRRLRRSDRLGSIESIGWMGRFRGTILMIVKS